MMGFIQRRQGHLEDSMRNLERAAELDPRDVKRSDLSSDITRGLGVMRNKNRCWTAC